MTEKAIREEWAAHTARSSRDAAALTAVQEVREPTPKRAIPLRSKVLQEAEKAINGDRDQEYGAPAVNFTNIASFWSTYLAGRLKDTEEITPGDVAAMNVLQKVARSMNTPAKFDHWVDTAGYAALAAEINQEKTA